ncbi:extracellular solute-binding protein [Synechococcus sp. HB1133]|uniref:extracellular solute-binding protein n=1 Tax=unclassified Synechococcus TaxID=2626047 RepID=UPI00140A7C77|nr:MULTISPECIES: extracellular solute-binding protein [unclassified Synechococcus]MCB4393956.1 extracellular solute-binding protein [Synechococcus sp. PH41509]MCB4421691.1 extracellular solute-binding protein [Synechococcus sp. HB1133]MCB4430957.1 extracellular solute-binding protein [Synechococcus sp. HBA1120]NHI80633.1 extracellular solute-binding protein [Synechococcus sp. HB1133]
MGLIRIQHLALGIALTALTTGCSSWRPPVVIKVVRTINNSETISSKDYERLREVTEDAIDHIRSVDPTIRPQLTLSTQKNFVDEIEDQTRSGFGPDLLITDSDTALELYKRNLVDPIDISREDRADTPSYLFDLVTAKDGKLVGRPVNQFVQLACFNKERLPSPPQTLEQMEQASEENNFGMALQLKDLFWSAESFDAGEAMEAALAKLPPDAERQANVTHWLQWLENASYQQNIRFLNDQRTLRDALVAGELDWITCWSSSLRELREQMKDKLALAPLPKGPSTKLKAATKLQVWSLGRNSSGTQREKALVMIDFITKPWAQKTYALAGRNSLPVNRKAAKIVAAKIPGGTEALVMYAQQSLKVNAAKGQSKARVFRDPERYETISDALLDTIYDVSSPEESSQKILKSLRESDS